MRSGQASPRRRLDPLAGVELSRRETPLVNSASLHTLDIALTLAALSVNSLDQIRGEG
jgi:hypothetical protein